MALSSCLCHPALFSLKIDNSIYAAKPSHGIRMDLRSTLSLKSINTVLFGKHGAGIAELSSDQGFLGGSRAITRSLLGRNVPCRKSSRVNASWLSSSQIASSVFTLGTAAVLPFYTLMVVAPKAELTKKSIESSIPYVVLGLLYAYLLYLSWTPDTLRLMFASKYWLPELPGMAKMFSNEMTLSSAWIHLLAIDLFAARQVYHDGLENKIETRHSISLCLMFCPIGIVSHIITKALTKPATKSKPEPRIH